MTLLPGILPTSGVLYFFIPSGYDIRYNSECYYHTQCQVMHYDPAPDAPPWPAPAPLPHGAVDPVHRELFNATFGSMRSSFESYRSSAPAPALHALTLPPYPRHELMSKAWTDEDARAWMPESSDDANSEDDRSSVDYGSSYDSDRGVDQWIPKASDQWKETDKLAGAYTRPLFSSPSALLRDTSGCFCDRSGSR